MIVKTRSGTVYKYAFFSNQINIVEEEISTDEDCFIGFSPKEEIYSLPRLDTFIIELTRDCNLRCSYCCYLGAYRHSRIHEHISLNEDQLDQIINFIRDNHKQIPINIGFYGGEPLLRFSQIKYFTEKAESIWNKDVTFSLSTNGVLLKNEPIEWLIQHQFKLNVSVDGGEYYHDKNRRTTDGEGSFKSVYENLCSIRRDHLIFFEQNVSLLMTYGDISSIKDIAIEWQSDNLLQHKAPAHISSLAPNYSTGVLPTNEQSLKKTLYELFDFFKSHPDNLVLNTFIDERIFDLKSRSIDDLSDENVMSTCLPYNRKCFIDVHGNIGVCEKMCDTYRIGNIYGGFDFEAINQMVRKMADIRFQRCFKCSIVRLCDTCLLALDLNSNELSVSCHNQYVSTRLYMLLMCELAEADLIQ